MSAQQSWTAWLLDAYANAVPAAPTEPSHDDDASEVPPTSISESQRSLSHTSSPYGPYLKTGRGGAGNFTWQSQQESPQSGHDDLEAQKPSTLSERRKAAAKIEHIDTGAAMRSKISQRPTSQYIRMGRGIVQSNEVQQSPRSVSFNVQSPVSPKLSTPLVAHPGRGGAGNHAAASELIEKAENEKQKRERVDAEQRREKIEEQVQNSLPAPPDAWLGGRRRSDGLPDLNQ